MNFFLISRHLTGKLFSGQRYLTFKIEIELQLLGCLCGKSFCRQAILRLFSSPPSLRTLLREFVLSNLCTDVSPPQAKIGRREFFLREGRRLYTGQCKVDRNIFKLVQLCQDFIHTYPDIFESAQISFRIQKFLSPDVSIRIQIEFARPHLTFPTRIRIHSSIQDSSGNIANRACIEVAILNTVFTGLDLVTSSDKKISRFSVRTIHSAFKTFHSGERILSQLRLRLPDSPDTCGQKRNPERNSCGFKNIRIRVHRA